MRNRFGQDLIEYALMAGFVAVAAGAIMPGVANSIVTIFTKVSSVMSAATHTGHRPDCSSSDDGCRNFDRTDNIRRIR
jgi:Flp pilus assembly pilin Flp